MFLSVLSSEGVVAVFRRLRFPVVLIVCGALSLCWFPAVASASPVPVFDGFRGYMGPPVVCLTFDDGPSGYTSGVLDVLEENGVEASFFCVGCEVSTAPVLVAREASLGHQVSSHTWSHPALSGLSPFSARGQVMRGELAVSRALGRAPRRVVRCPYGDAPVSVSGLVSPNITWSVDTLDWSRPGVDFIVSRVLSCRSGDVVLLHDGGGNRGETVKALRRVVPVLRLRGYRFMTVDELRLSRFSALLCPV